MRLPNIEPEVWAARPLLKSVQIEAHRRCAGADAVLWSLLVCIAAHIPARVSIDTGIGVPIRPTLFAVLAGLSGSGKSIGFGVARGLLPPSAPEPLPLSTGEGLIESFYGEVPDYQQQPPTADGAQKAPKLVWVRRRLRSNALFWLDEGETLFRQMEKPGNVVGPTLRSFWSGGTVGQQNASKDSRRTLDAGTYTGGLVVGLQPGISGRLLADTATGTAQRFVWAASTDRYLTDDPGAPAPFGFGRLPWAQPELPGMPTSLEQFRAAPQTGAAWQPPPELPPVAMTLDPAISRTIKTEQLALRRGDGDPPDEQDTQRTTLLVKLAAVLAWIDGRLTVSADDWQIALRLLDTSNAVRTALTEYAEDAKHQERRDRGIERAEVTAAESKAEAQRDQLTTDVRRKIIEASEQGITRADLTRAFGGARRPLLPLVLTALVESGKVEEITAHSGGRRYRLART